MRKRAVIALSFFQKANNTREPLHPLRQCDEVALDADHDGHDAEAACASSNDAGIAGHTFQSHSRDRMRAPLPVIAETLFLQHGEQFIVGHWIRLGADWPGES